MDVQLEIRLFGGLTLFSGDTPLPSITGAIARSLFAYLVTYRERSHTRDLLVGTFWPDRPEAVARRRLSQALWQIRQVLPPSLLLIDGATIQCDPTYPLWCDVTQFTHHYSQAETEPERAFEHYQQCIDLYQDDFMAGYYEDWVLIERERLREMCLNALAQLIERCKRASDYERALIFARQLSSQAPWREEAHREIMRLCHLLGRDAEALKQLEICRRVLAKELGVEPSSATESLAAEIATRSGVFEPPVLPTAARPIVAPLLKGADRLSLVGRQSELAELLRRVEAATAGKGGLTLVYGEAGVGKTRLLKELAQNAQWRGVPTLWGRCYELSAPPAYQPLVEALRAGLSVLGQTPLEPLWRAELSRLLPELAPGVSRPPALQPDEERRRLLEAIARGFMALTGVQPHLVILEDAHWMDPASLEALRYLLPRLSDVPLCFVVSVRTEELSGEPALGLDALHSTHLPHRLDLERLNPAETGQLVRCALGLEQDAPRFNARLFAETEGNPFFLLETLRVLVDEGLLYRGQDGAWHTPWDESTQDYAELPLPAGIVQSIERRLDRLPGPLKELVELAAAIGRGVVFDVLLEASQWNERELMFAGEDFCTRGLFVPAGQDMALDYVFAHDQIRRVAFQRLTAPRRRFYHRRVAQALTRLGKGEPETLAHHWTQAQEWAQAADHHQRAGERAREVFANAKAVAHYTQALQALERLGQPPDPLRTFELLLARERVYDLQGARKAQSRDLMALEQLAKALDDDRRRAEVALHRARQARLTSDFASAIASAELAFHLAEAAQDVIIEIKSCLEWGWALLFQADYVETRSRFEQVRALAQTARLRRWQAEGLRGLGTLCLVTGDYAEAKAYFDEVLTICRELDMRQSEASALSNLGYIFGAQGDSATSKAYYERALRINQEIGDQRGIALVTGNLGGQLLAEGDFTAARTCHEQTLAIRRSVQDREGEGVALRNIGQVYHQQGDYPRAKSYYEQALSIFYELGTQFYQGQILAFLSLLYHHLDDNQAAREYGHKGLRIAQDIDDRRGQGWLLDCLGHALTGLGQLDQAADAYEQALAVRRELNQPHLVTESQAGLARLALIQDKNDRAQEYVEAVLTYLKSHNLNGTSEPFRVYLTCYHILQVNDDPRAHDILTTAHDLLQKRAARIEDDALRRSFLENVSAHRRIIAAYRERQARSSGSRLTVVLPRADAPTGRPLSDDEYVQVTWTLAAPQDQAISDGARRRRHRLLRLLREAREQGAAPTVAGLAQALQVSRRTIKRDLATLREAGHSVPTRGSRS